jgi:hypothetical protein
MWLMNPTLSTGLPMPPKGAAASVQTRINGAGKSGSAAVIEADTPRLRSLMWRLAGARSWPVEAGTSGLSLVRGIAAESRGGLF